MTTGYSHQVLEALDDSNPRESIFRVKQVVARELEAFDDSAEVRLTEHFNHTFSPDMVLVWPTENRTRQVYLRFTDDLTALIDDFPLLDVANNPMVFGLTSPNGDEQSRKRLELNAREAGIFVTEPLAIETLMHPKDEQRNTSRMLRNSLAQGGKGALIGRPIAENLAKVIQDGISGAGELKVTETAAALDAMENFLAAPQASRLTQVLHAVWDGANGRIDQFPGIRELPGKLNTPALLFLLEYMESADPTFWRKIGRGISITELAKLSSVSHTDNFQHLVNANLNSIGARACRVFENPLGMDDSDGALFSWKPTRKLLELSGPGFTAQIGDLKDDLAPDVHNKKLPKSQNDKNNELGINVKNFIHRWRDMSVIDVHIADEKDIIDYSTKDNNINKVALQNKAAAFSSTPYIEKSTFSTRTGRVSIDFVNRTGTGITRSELLMADLICVAVPMLADLEDDAYIALETIFSDEIDRESVEIPFFDDNPNN
ncbi:MAG TPA: hypothetical protein VMW30_07710 [Candidatus Paceibacterota bacterium]|nr:hypothetical protein [Candidatus Paceibacterota bacterium]